jgi:hypothetical protein
VIPLSPHRKIESIMIASLSRANILGNAYNRAGL